MFVPQVVIWSETRKWYWFCSRSFCFPWQVDISSRFSLSKEILRPARSDALWRRKLCSSCVFSPSKLDFWQTNQPSSRPRPHTVCWGIGSPSRRSWGQFHGWSCLEIQSSGLPQGVVFGIYSLCMFVSWRDDPVWFIIVSNWVEDKPPSDISRKGCNLQQKSGAQGGECRFFKTSRNNGHMLPLTELIWRAWLILSPLNPHLRSMRCHHWRWMIESYVSEFGVRKMTLILVQI